MFIDPNLTVDENQIAVITQYDFEVRDNAGHFEITDPVIRANLPARAKVGKYTGGNLDVVLAQAIEKRNDFITRNAADAAAKPAKKAKADPTDIKGVTLDDSGKPAKAPKKLREPAVRKDNRYLRMFRIIAAQPDITKAQLSAQASVSTVIADYDGLNAWASYVSLLGAKGKVVLVTVPEEPKGKSIYMRAREMLFANPEATTKDLSKNLEKVSEASASWCIMAWNAALQVLGERNCLAVAQDTIEAPAAEQPAVKAPRKPRPSEVAKKAAKEAAKAGC